jgi:hypothetical protein
VKLTELAYSVAWQLHLLSPQVLTLRNPEAHFNDECGISTKNVYLNFCYGITKHFVRAEKLSGPNMSVCFTADRDCHGGDY